MSVKQVKDEEIYLESIKIRKFELLLLDLFKDNLISGTTHTCLGQEHIASAAVKNLPENSIVISNHRCHGHFLAKTNNYEGLLHEILGSKQGVVGGIGGSQHLCVPDVFFSNGILGGTLPLSIGLAFAKKTLKEKGIVCIFLGDGVLGEGTTYECLNIASLYNLEILFVVENNNIAQSTKTKKIQSGEISKRFEAFNIPISELIFPDISEINKECKSVIKKIENTNRPYVLIIECDRLGPHSKGDDNRSEVELKIINNRDPLSKTNLGNLYDKKVDETTCDFIKKLRDKVINELDFDFNLSNYQNKSANKIIERSSYLPVEDQDKIFVKRINKYYANLLANDERVFFFGEDVEDPYGGAFKVSAGLSDKFPLRVFSTPISEAAIIGMAGGMAIKGLRPIVEIMFSDFLTLGADQIVNHITKFSEMYNNKINLTLNIRTAVGGGRGYGPTHSQNMEKLFFGVTNLSVYALSPFFPTTTSLDCTLNSNTTNLIIEGKKDYGKKVKLTNNLVNGVFETNYLLLDDNVYLNCSLTNFKNDKFTILTYGINIENCLDALEELAIEYELFGNLISPLKISPLNLSPILKEISSEIVFTCEENNVPYGFGSECLSILIENSWSGKACRIGNKGNIIPNSIKLEEKMLISTSTIIEQILKKIEL